MNIKLLEAMAAGVPGVTTVTGARGLPAALRSGVCVVGDDAADEFAAEVVRLARDRGLRRDRGLAAREDAKRWHLSHVATLRRCLGTPEP
jgi:glycosyltransferase involved in cell wall biosynthesis